jgi:hypothetical protein
VLATLVLIPFAFRGRIEQRLRVAVNDGLDARVNWRSIGLSVLRDFPAVTLTVDGPSAVGTGVFAGDTLVSMERARLALDLGSVVAYLRRGAPIVVREVTLEAPRADLRVLADGRANWQVTRPSPATGASGRPVSVTLRALQITRGALRLDDRHANVVASVRGLDERMSGDFAKQKFHLVTRTRMDSASFRMAGIEYLSHAAVAVDAGVDADMQAHRFTLRDDTLRVNALTVGFGGRVTAGSPAIALNVAFNAPGNSVRDLLSLVPALYSHDFASLRATGTMAVAGSVRGSYGPNAFPALRVDATVTNGAFRYASLPAGASDIAIQLSVTNPGGAIDSTVVALQRLHATIAGRPVDARMVVRTPVSDPEMDLAVSGGVDLAALARTVPMAGVRGLGGLVAANFAVHARQSDLDVRRAERIDARGSLNLSRVTFATDSLPLGVHLDTASVSFTPAAVRLTRFAARYGRSDVRATGTLDDFLGFLLRGDDLRATASVRSRVVNLEELVARDTTRMQVVPVPAHVDLALDAAVDRVEQGKLVATDVRGRVQVKDQRVTLSELHMRALGGGVVASGWYETVTPARPAFDVTLGLDSIDVSTAFASLVTVQKIAPVARWAQGRVSGVTTLRGTADTTMTPDFNTLAGSGTAASDRLALQGLPMLGKVADVTGVEALRNPALGAIRTAFTIANGRVIVRPFTVDAAGVTLTVAGSHGLDQTLEYNLQLGVPRVLAGGRANDAIAKLAARAGASAALAQAPVVRLAAKVTGTVTDPRVAVDFAGTAASVKEGVTAVVRDQAEARAADVKQALDSAAAAAKQRARAETQRIVVEATQRADSLRAAGSAAAAALRAAAASRADSLVAKATNPVAKRAAELAAGRLKKEADQRATAIEKDADARAAAMIEQARARAASGDTSSKSR